MTKEIERRLSHNEGAIKSILYDRKMSDKEIFNRLTVLEIARAEAKGVKMGIVMTTTFFWAVIVAGLTAAWKWAHN